MKIVSFRGGFHNAPEIHFRAETIRIGGAEHAVLSAYQMNRLKRHFCGMSDCCCYSWPSPHPDSLPDGPYYVEVHQ